MNHKEFQALLTSRLREMLDPIVVEAGYSPDDYKIVWRPLDPPQSTSKWVDLIKPYRSSCQTTREDT